MKNLDKINPIFIIGVPRSGTTLLRVLLDTHNKIAAAPETPWILGGYSDVSLRSLINFVLNDKVGAVKNLSGVTEDIIYKASVNFLEPIFQSYIEAKKKQFLVLNTPDDVENLELLLKLFPNSKYIHIYRDGRDVACSTIKYKDIFFGDKHLREYGDFNYPNTLKRWYQWERKIRSILNSNSKYKYIRLSYENLVTKPHEIIKSICKFLEVDYEKDMIEYSKHKHDYPNWEAGSLDVKTKKKINNKSINRWEKELTNTQIIESEKLYGTFLKELKYKIADKKSNVLKNENTFFHFLITNLNYKRIETFIFKRVMLIQNLYVNITNTLRLLFKKTFIGKFDLKNQIFADYGTHRSEFRKFLKPLNNPKGIFLDTCIEKTFYWHPKGIHPIQRSWIGMIHNPPKIPEWFDNAQSNRMIFESNAFLKSQSYCKGLYTFSKYHKESIETQFDFPINSIYHPADFPDIKWDWKKFQSNNQKKIVQIGWWLRKFHSIYLLKVNKYRKIFIRKINVDIDRFMKAELENEYSGYFPDELYKTVETYKFLSNRKYDTVLSENIIFLDLYNSSANNTIIECMTRNTPLLVNPLPAVIEYLGVDYPFYFNSLEEAGAKADDFELIFDTHIYLKNNPITENIRKEHFIKSIMNSEIYKSI